MTHQITDTEQYSVPAVWSTTYAVLKGTDWTHDDVESVKGVLTTRAEAARTLKYVYDEMSKRPRLDPEDGVLAVLRATREHHNRIFLSPVEVAAMADGFLLYYTDFDEPLTNYLDEHYNGLNPDWLNERGRKGMEDELTRESEIWIDDPDLSGVWVFTRPGHQP